MRRKTDTKRQEILKVAKNLFMKYGLETVSMAQISEKLGGSKGTLYGYFKNKEDLFVEVTLMVIQDLVSQAALALDPTLPLKDKLRILGKKYVKLGLSDDVMALRRNFSNYPSLGKQGKEAYNRALHGVWGYIARLVEEGVKDGLLKKTDPWLAAMQLKSLFELDIVERHLLNLDKKIDQKEIDKNIDLGLEIFFSYYTTLK